MQNFNKITKKIHKEKDFSVITTFMNCMDDHDGTLVETIPLENLDQFNFTHLKSEISKMVVYYIEGNGASNDKLTTTISMLPSARSKKSTYI